jgi:hypothetical protein
MIGEPKGGSDTAGATPDAAKKCRACAETVKADALICRYCRHDFRIGAVVDPQASPPSPIQTQGTNGFSVASLVLGVLWLYGVGSILALVFGYIAKGQIDRSGAQQSGRGMAIAGIVLGWIGVAVLLLVLVAFLVVRVSGTKVTTGF